MVDELAAKDAHQAIASLGWASTLSTDGVLTVRLHNGRETQFAPVERWVLSPGRASDVVRRLREQPVDAPPLVVSERIPEPARRVLTALGVSWLDRRGHLCLIADNVHIDRRVAATSRSRRPALPRFPAGRTGLGVALVLLADAAAETDRRRNLADVARLCGVAISGVSSTLSTFKALGLVDDQRRPVLPDLFWSASEQWRPTWTGLAEPVDVDRDLLEQLGANFVDLRRPGWCLGGPAAAEALGAPGVGGVPPGGSWFVPDEATLEALAAGSGTATGDKAIAYVAVAPTVALCSLRTATAEGTPVAPLAAVALDLAADVARGHEMLDAWIPSEGKRIW